MRILNLLILSIFLTGCATLPPEPLVPVKQPQSWQERKVTLSKLQNWDITAVMAIRTNNDAESAHLKWQQNKQNYHLSLYGPLGMGAMTISGRPGSVTLATAEGKTFHASTPESLLMQQTGWQLPVSHLYYWIRGLPVKDVPANMQFDASHHLAQLKQSGWTVNFLRYDAVNQIDLPEKMFLDNGQVKVKIIINQWKF